MRELGERVPGRGGIDRRGGHVKWGGGTEMMVKRILTPIDGPERQDTIVPVVAALARGAGSTVRLLRVFPIPQLVTDASGRTVAYADQEMSRLTAEGLDELAHIEAELQGIPVERVVRFGEPAEEIRLEAEAFDADLVTVTATRRGRLSRTLVPGVAERVVRDAAVPTLVLHG
jgi:nucleotide-binding universal stress UspA family protein